jgi:RNA recognition motif. (a.k.a. RRM, RBD, or RNP domain)
VKANFAADRDKRGPNAGGGGAAAGGSAMGGAGAGGFMMGGAMGGAAPMGTVVDKTLRKFFLRSLPFSADEDRIKAHFSQLGEVEEVAIVREKETQKPRGFGFLTMKYLEGACKVFEQAHLIRLIEGREIIIQLAAAGRDGPQLQGHNFGECCCKSESANKRLVLMLHLLFAPSFLVLSPSLLPFRHASRLRYARPSSHREGDGTSW